MTHTHDLDGNYLGETLLLPALTLTTQTEQARVRAQANELLSVLTNDFPLLTEWSSADYWVDVPYEEATKTFKRSVDTDTPKSIVSGYAYANYDMLLLSTKRYVVQGLKTVVRIEHQQYGSSLALREAVQSCGLNITSDPYVFTDQS